MNRPRAVVLTAMLVLVAAIGPAVAASQPVADDSTETSASALAQAENQTTDATPPGAVLSGVIGVQHAEMNGAIERRALGLRVAGANTNETRAAVLNRTQERLQERLQELERRLEGLRAARENGSITEGEYRARVTIVAAETATVRSVANETAQIARGLPASVLAANGVNVTAIERLRERARTMTGPEVAAIARQIAGEHVGAPMGPPSGVPAPPHAGPPTTESPTGGNGSGGATHGRPTTTTDQPTTGDPANTTADRPTSDRPTTTRGA